MHGIVAEFKLEKPAVTTIAISLGFPRPNRASWLRTAIEALQIMQQIACGHDPATSHFREFLAAWQNWHRQARYARFRG